MHSITGRRDYKIMQKEELANGCGLKRQKQPKLPIAGFLEKINLLTMVDYTT